MTDEVKSGGEEMERVSFRLGGGAMERVRALSKKRGMTITEFVRRAIGTEAFLFEEIEKGARLIIEDRDDRQRQLIFHK